VSETWRGRESRLQGDHGCSSVCVHPRRSEVSDNGGSSVKKVVVVGLEEAAEEHVVPAVADTVEDRVSGGCSGAGWPVSA
jgi:hypothetical protein